MQTDPLKNPKLPLIVNDPRKPNVLGALKFFFPLQSSQSGLAKAVIAGFGGNDAAYLKTHPKKESKLSIPANYTPDDSEYFDPSKSFGIIINRPAYGTLELGNTDVHIADGNTYTGIDGGTYTFDNIVFPIAIVDARQSKNIIKTKITGRDGEIKEYIGMNDWAITISSVVDMPPDEAPLDFLDAFLQLLSAQVTIPVKNYYLNALGISNIVIEDVDLGQAEGGYSSQPIRITACSDIPLTDFLP